MCIALSDRVSDGARDKTLKIIEVYTMKFIVYVKNFTIYEPYIQQTKSTVSVQILSLNSNGELVVDYTCRVFVVSPKCKAHNIRLIAEKWVALWAPYVWTTDIYGSLNALWLNLLDSLCSCSLKSFHWLFLWLKTFESKENFIGRHVKSLNFKERQVNGKQSNSFRNLNFRSYPMVD